MPICGGCGANYASTTIGCPNCKQIRAIEKQTKLQAKQFKAQQKAMSGAGGGGGMVVGLVTAFFNFVIVSGEMALRINLAMWKGIFGWLSARHAQNPDAFWKRFFQISMVILALIVLLTINAIVMRK